MLEDCKEKGMVRSLGLANFTIQAIMNLYPFVEHKPVVNQVESHPFLVQKHLHNLCKKLKIVMVAYCPLMRGGKDQKVLFGDKIDYMADPTLK
jgi:diketogulonate reductase-like aldo/keto reductase